MCVGLLFLAAFLVPIPSSGNEISTVTLTLTLRHMQQGGDTDGDGIDDTWEIRLFGNLDLASRTSDFDLDGFDDYAEYVAGTDPKDPESALQIAGIKTLPNGYLQIVWSSTTNNDPSPRLYDIFAASSMQDLQTNKIVLGEDIPSGGNETILNNIPPGGAAHRFYGINVKIDH